MTIDDSNKDLFSVSLRASFVSLKFMNKISKWWCLWHNSFNPELQIKKDTIVYKCIFRKEKQLTAIEYVDVANGWFTNNVIFFFKNSQWVFIVNVSGDEVQSRLLRLLRSKQVTLTVLAKSFATAEV